ncbi:MAG: GNAT family N-acetyltransferase [Nocardioidaceae bacterium]
MSQKLLSSPALRVMVIIASTRPGRLGPAVARWFLDATDAETPRGGEVDVADLAEIGLPFLDEPEHPSSGDYKHEHTRAWSRRVAAAGAFIVVTPEYNYSMPASLKNALDFLYEEWAWKPVAFVSYGNTSAGTRGVQMTKQVVTTLRMVPVGATVALRIADRIEDGLVRTSAALEESARAVLAEVTEVATALRPLRPSAESPADSSPRAEIARAEPATDSCDRATEAPVTGLHLAAFTPADAAELLVLQRACWVQEALANETLDHPALRETVEEVRNWAASWQVWCVRRDGRLLAAVRARATEENEGSAWEIGRLMVAPDLSGHGVGRWLLAYAESQAPSGTTTIALCTGSRSHRNITLYQRAGYHIAHTPGTDTPSTNGTVHLAKLPQ